MRNMVTYGINNGVKIMDQFSEKYRTGMVKPTPEEIHFYGREITKIVLNRMVTDFDLRNIDSMFINTFGFDRFLNLFSLAMFREDSSEFHPEDAEIIKRYHDVWDHMRAPADLNVVVILCQEMTKEPESEGVLTNLGFVPDWYSYGLIDEIRYGETFKEITKNFRFATFDDPIPLYRDCTKCHYFIEENDYGDDGLFDLNPNNTQQ